MFGFVAEVERVAAGRPATASTPDADVVAASTVEGVSDFEVDAAGSAVDGEADIGGRDLVDFGLSMASSSLGT